MARQARNCPQPQNERGSKHRAKKANEQDSDSEEHGGTLFVASVGLKADAKDADWIIDSGASRHMTFQKKKSETLQKFKEFQHA